MARNEEIEKALEAFESAVANRVLCPGYPDCTKTHDVAPQRDALRAALALPPDPPGECCRRMREALMFALYECVNDNDDCALCLACEAKLKAALPLPGGEGGRPMSRAWAMGQLRHLYAQMVDPESNGNPAAAAKGLLGPAIQALEYADVASAPAPVEAPTLITCDLYRHGAVLKPSLLHVQHPECVNPRPAAPVESAPTLKTSADLMAEAWAVESAPGTAPQHECANPMPYFHMRVPDLWRCYSCDWTSPRDPASAPAPADVEPWPLGVPWFPHICRPGCDCDTRAVPVESAPRVHCNGCRCTEPAPVESAPGAREATCPKCGREWGPPELGPGEWNHCSFCGQDAHAPASPPAASPPAETCSECGGSKFVLPPGPHKAVGFPLPMPCPKCSPPAEPRCVRCNQERHDHRPTMSCHEYMAPAAEPGTARPYDPRDDDPDQGRGA